MAIEFRCTQCNRLLRTADETAGKQAQCPECGAITTIPAASTATSGDAMPPPPMPPSGGPSSYGGAAPIQPEAYNVPLTLEQTQAEAYAARRVAAPATALIVISILGILGQIVFFFQLASFGVDAVIPPLLKQIPEVAALPADVLTTASAIGGGVTLIVCIVMLVGARNMKRLQGYTSAVIAAVLAVVPCTSPCCCLLGLPFGVWALVVLNDASVKSAFRR